MRTLRVAGASAASAPGYVLLAGARSGRILAAAADDSSDLAEAKMDALLEAGEGAGPSVIGRAFLQLERDEQAAEPAGPVALATRGDDSAMWVPIDGSGAALGFEAAARAVAFRSGAGETQIKVELAAESPPTFRLADGGLEEDLFSVLMGPAKLPSEHLAELRAVGLTKLRVCSPAQVEAMKAAIGGRMDELIARREAAGAEISGHGRVQEFSLQEDEDEGRTPERPDRGSDARAGAGAGFLLAEQCPEFARLHSHPVQLHILESFVGSSVRAAHPPTTRITMPQDGSLGGGGGWHCGEPEPGPRRPSHPY